MSRPNKKREISINTHCRIFLIVGHEDERRRNSDASIGDAKTDENERNHPEETQNHRGHEGRRGTTEGNAQRCVPLHA